MKNIIKYGLYHIDQKRLVGANYSTLGNEDDFTVFCELDVDGATQYLVDTPEEAEVTRSGIYQKESTPHPSLYFPNIAVSSSYLPDELKVVKVVQTFEE